MIKLTLDPEYDEGCPSFCGPSCAQYNCCSHHIEDCDFSEDDSDEGNSFDEEYYEDYYQMAL